MKIVDNVHLLESTKGGYAYLVAGNEIVLIDTGFPWQGKAILKELKSLEIKPYEIKHILLTHYDLDHIGNAVMLQKITGAKLWASVQDIPYIKGDLHRPGFKKYLAYIFRVKKPIDITPFKPGQSINGIEVIPTPGHTPGHVCFLYKDVLFAGDILENKNGELKLYPSAWNWNNSIMMESIKKITGFSYKWLCPAHGMPIERNYQCD